MHDGMPYGRNQGQGHSREVDRQSPTGLIFNTYFPQFALLMMVIHLPRVVKTLVVFASRTSHLLHMVFVKLLKSLNETTRQGLMGFLLYCIRSL